MLNIATSLHGAWNSARRRVAGGGLPDAAILAIGLALALALRVELLSFRSADFNNSIRDWYAAIRDLGFAVFGTDFSTYNPPYLYQLYVIARFLPDIPNVYAIKIPSLVTDFICAYYVYKIVALKYGTPTFAMLAAFAFLFAPTVVLNSAFWGQADVLYTAPLLACLYFLMTRRNNLAFIAFGIAMAFKLQAIFLIPLLLGLLLRGQVSWRHFLWIPVVLFVAVLPSWLAGRPLLDLLGVYVGQTQIFQRLQMFAPTVYTWLPDVGLTQHYFTATGIIFAVGIAFAYALLIYKSAAPLTVPMLLKLALVSVLFVPFFLPRMHDRYFYPADVIAIIYAFYFPRYFFVPILIVMASFFAYQHTLFNTLTAPMPLLAAGIFAALLVAAKDAITTLYSAEGEVEPVQKQ